MCYSNSSSSANQIKMNQQQQKKKRKKNKQAKTSKKTDWIKIAAQNNEIEKRWKQNKNVKKKNNINYVYKYKYTKDRRKSVDSSMTYFTFSIHQKHFIQLMHKNDFMPAHSIFV